jgi:membrane fusion protein (multidrug efflux system)
VRIGRRMTLIAGLAAALVVAAVFGVRLWRYYQSHVSTDDAYVQADSAQVTARIDGTVIELLAEENARLRQGDPILKLDPAEYVLKLREADAAVASAIQSVEEMKAAVLTAESTLAVAEAEFAQNRLDHARAEQLAGRDVVPKERLDRMSNALRAGEARMEAARREVARARAALGVPLEAPATDQPSVRQAIAARDMAALHLSYTDIRAPITGVMGRRAVEIGQRIKSGQPLTVMVPLARVYVVANFKETQLAAVRVGQPTQIVADVYPEAVYKGHVESLAPGSGAAFALLPPENASGNWVKVVQRVPVRIALDESPEDHRPLRVGLSVVATIDVTGEAAEPKRSVAEAEPRSP